MATFKKTLSGDSRYRIELKIVESNTNISTNTSDVDYELAAYKSSGSGYYTSSKTNPIKVVIDGATIVNKNIAYDFRNTTKIVLASGTVRDIQHNADGTKTIQCSGYFKDNENSLGSGTASGSLELTVLHKAPEPRITNTSEQESALLNFVYNVNETFVANISRKSFSINATLYDSATISSYKVGNGNYYSTLFTPSILNFKTIPLTIENNKVPISVSITDSLGAIGTTIVEYENFILYTKPTLVASNLKTPRDGQLTGKVKLIANGTYFNDVDNQFSQTLIPTLKYSIKEKDSNTYILQNQELTPTYADGNWEIETNIGSDDPNDTTPTSSNPAFYFNPQYSYEIEVEIIDNLIDGISGVSTSKSKSIVLVGESIMTKYKDKVDFKKITIKKVNPFEAITGSLDSITKTGGNSNVTGTFSKCNNVVCYDLSITTTGSTAGGSNIFEGTITDFLPKIDTILTGYIGNRAIIGSLTTTGSLTIRNASDSSLGSGSNPSVRGTFII